MAGKVEAIFLTSKKGTELGPVSAVNAIAGAGLEGDRYAAKAGTFSKQDAGRHLTLIEAEAFEHLKRECGIELGQHESRRNVVTRGIALNDLVGKKFRVGPVECIGVRLCDPCGHLEKLTQRGVKLGLDNRGGLRADVAVSGLLSVGDVVEEL